MQLQLIRSATLRIEYAGHTFVIDPYLAAKHLRPSFSGKSLNPLVDLPCSPLEVIAGAQMVILSQLHSDHFDPAAQELLPKDALILSQPEDDLVIRAKGFRSVIPVEDTINWEGTTITRTLCEHGSGDVLKEMGNASGFVFRSQNEPTVSSARLSSTRIDAAAPGGLLLTFALLAASILDSLAGPRPTARFFTEEVQICVISL